jgi:hypothetical protein
MGLLMACGSEVLWLSLPRGYKRFYTYLMSYFPRGYMALLSLRVRFTREKHALSNFSDTYEHHILDAKRRDPTARENKLHSARSNPYIFPKGVYLISIS